MCRHMIVCACMWDECINVKIYECMNARSNAHRFRNLAAKLSQY